MKISDKIWITRTDTRVGVSISTDCDTMDEATAKAEAWAEDGYRVIIEQRGHVLGSWNADLDTEIPKGKGVASTASN